MKVLFILEAGIPEYRVFLFEQLAKDNEIDEFLVLHNGLIYNGGGNFKSNKVKFIGNNKLGIHFGLLKYIRRFDVVISSYNLRILTCWLPVFFKKKYVFWGKGLGSNESYIVKCLRTITARKAAHILVYNDVKKEELIKLTGVGENKITAYNNTIEVSNPELIKSSKFYFLYFGRIQERKGLLELIREYFKYVNIVPSHGIKKLRFVGNGEFKKILQKEVKRLDLEKYVDFYPGVYDDESIKNHFRNAVAYVSPYNVGLGVINSFAYGVPVVTCSKKQVGPEYYYLDGRNAFIIDDIEDLSKTLLNLSLINLEEYNTYCFDYYSHLLTSDNMYQHFIKTINKVYNE